LPEGHGEATLNLEAVPEPATIFVWSILGAIGAAIGWYRRRKSA